MQKRRWRCRGGGGNTTRCSAVSEQTVSAASNVHPPANTDTLDIKVRSFSVSKPKLQSIAARKVCWRAIDVLLPPVRRRNRSSNLPAICSTANACTRAAASSIANGRPSKC